MTARQKILKAVYPLWTWFGRVTGKNATVLTNNKAVAPVSFYSLKGTLNNGNTLDFDSLRGKKVLLVNTASDCGYTGQYDELEKLSKEFNSQLVVVGFPANDFKEQEKEDDAAIAQFCKLNFGVTFPLMKKSVVVKRNDQNNIFKWLSDKTKNGWNSKEPSWNFSKYLVNENGQLINFFGPSISPLSNEVLTAIKTP